MRQKNALGKGAAGFTIIEVLVTCVIMAVLASIAIPGFYVWLPRYHLKNAARDLYSNMQLTKMTAIRNNANVSLTYSAGPDQYLVGATNQTVILSEYGDGVLWEGPGGQTFATATITFNSRGLCNQGYAYLSNAKNSAYYRIGPLTSGVIQFHKYNSGTGQWE